MADDTAYAVAELWRAVEQRDRPARVVIALGSWLLPILSALDLLTTRYLLDRGLGYEANWLMALVVLSWLAVPLKVGLPAVVGWHTRSSQRSPVLAIGVCVAVGVYVAVVMHNASLVVAR